MDGWTFLDQKRVWVISGYGTGSVVNGSTARISSLQQGFPHYYQRPDRPDLGVDPNATSLAGWGARAWLNKQQGARAVQRRAGGVGARATTTTTSASSSAATW